MELEKLLKNKSFTLASHDPILTSLFSTFNVSGVVEFGMGTHSTKIFLEEGVQLVSIEHDKEWFDRMNEEFGHSENVNFFHSPLDVVGIKTKTKIHELTKQQVDYGIKMYHELIDSFTSVYNLLFVDHISGMRLHTIREFYENFSFTVFHDAQHPGYRYDKIERFLKREYNLYVYKTLGVYTGLIIKKEYDEYMDSFIRNLKLHEMIFTSPFECFEEFSFEKVI